MYDNVDWYEILGVAPTASEVEIELAWRQKISEEHPDRNKSEDANEIAKLINMARDTLLDRSRRLQFDMWRTEWKRREKAQREERAKRQRQQREQAGRNSWSRRETMLRIELLKMEKELQNERDRRIKAERRLRSEEDFNSEYRFLYDEQIRRAEEAEARAVAGTTACSRCRAASRGSGGAIG